MLDADAEALIAADADGAQEASLLRSVLGVGAVVARGLLALLVGLGHLGHRALARLAGVALVAQASGSCKRRRRCVGEGVVGRCVGCCIGRCGGRLVLPRSGVGLMSVEWLVVDGGGRCFVRWCVGCDGC